MSAGSLPDWVNAIGTVLTFFGAAFAAVVALRSYRSQREEIQQQLRRHDEELMQRTKAERMQQASRVAVWVVRTARRWHVNISNGSDLPVFDMAVRFSGDTFDAHIFRGVQSPTATKRSDMLTMALRALLSEAETPDVYDLHVECVFTDAAGLRWHRRTNGNLREVVPEFTLPGEAIAQLEVYRQHPELYEESRRVRRE